MDELLAQKHEGELRQIEPRGWRYGVSRSFDGRFARLVLFGRAALSFARLFAGARPCQGARLRKGKAQYNQQRKYTSHLTVLYGCRGQIVTSKSGGCLAGEPFEAAQPVERGNFVRLGERRVVEHLLFKISYGSA